MMPQRHAEANSQGEARSSGSGAVSPGGSSNGEESREFLSTGRTGRRNAMPDIRGKHATTGTADLHSKMEGLSTNGNRDQPSSSGMGTSETFSPKRPKA